MKRVLNGLFMLYVVLTGVYLSLLGGYLSYLGGSHYYVISGLVLTSVAWFYFRASTAALKLYGLGLAATLIWSIVESEGFFWALLPRLAMWLVLATWFFLPFSKLANGERGAMDNAIAKRWIGIPAALSIASLVFFAANNSYPVVEGTQNPVSSAEPITDWRHYGNTSNGTRFAELEQINSGNVAQLQEVWRYRTGVEHDFKGTPLQVDGTLYMCAAGNVLIAIDDSTGKEKWRYDPVVIPPGEHQYARTCRGVSYYESASAQGQCAARIVTGTLDSRLIAVDANTGELCSDFGEAGEVDITTGIGDVHRTQYYLTSPPLVANNLLVIGGLVVDTQRLGLPSGVVRAFSAETGELAWAWDIGRPDSNELPQEGETYTRGTPNAWSIMSFDADLGLVYVPTGNANPDYFGGERREIDDKWASSIVALDVTTGQPRWSFQTVHHDVWDYDVPSQPTLVDVEKDGKTIPAVAVPTKRGEIFLLDRRNGEPVHPIEERPVPQEGVDGERLAATQPFSSLPHFRPYMHERDMWGLTPLDQLLCRVEYNMMRYEGHFTPPTTGGTLQYPGNFGGFNWGSISVDADNGLLVAAPMLLANRTMLVTPEQVDNAGAVAAKLLGALHPAVNISDADAELLKQREGYTPHDETGEFDYRKVKYFGLVGPFISRFKLPLIGGTEVPCFEPPWSQIAVIDLNTNKLLWKKPLGDMSESGPFGLRLGLPIDIGVPLRAGTLTTRGGLTFAASTMDGSVRAFDLRSGETLWKEELPGNGQATPMTYVSPKDGKQYLIVTVPNPSWRYPREPKSGTYTDSQSVVDGQGGYVIAYAIE